MTSPTETREAVARTIKEAIYAAGPVWSDAEVADLFIAAHLTPRDAEIESLRAKRDELKTALDEMVATIDPTIDLIQRQRSWQAYGERLERNADAALADEIQTQRKRVVEMKSEVRTAASERDAALSEVSRLTAALAESERQGAVMREALKPFCFGDPTLERILWGDMPDDALGTVTIKLADIRRARAALTLKEPTHEH